MDNIRSLLTYFLGRFNCKCLTVYTCQSKVIVIYMNLCGIKNQPLNLNNENGELL